MRIARIELVNFRQYENCTISLEKKNQEDLTVLIGRNGAGKTNVLNAINWCLYGDEPHLSKQSEGLPGFNVRLLKILKDGEDTTVSVRLCVETKEKQQVTFERSHVYRVMTSRGKKTWNVRTKDFSVRAIDDANNCKYFNKEEAERIVNRFVPQDIRDFFFFDGEKLNNYFREATGQRIRATVLRLSQIDVLTSVEERLNGFVTSMRREASRGNADISAYNKKLEEINEYLKHIEEEIRELERQKSLARDKIGDYRQRIEGFPPVRELTARRDAITLKVDDETEWLREARREKASFLVKAAKLVMLLPLVQKAIELIRAKLEAGEIPPAIDKGVIEATLSAGKCKLCKRPIDGEIRESLERLRNETMSRGSGLQLARMEPLLRQGVDAALSADAELARLDKKIQEYEKSIERLENEKKDIGRKLTGFNESEVEAWFNELENYEALRENVATTLGVRLAQKEAAEKERDTAKDALNAEIEKDQRLAQTRHKLKFCQVALRYLDTTRKAVLDDVRSRIEHETAKNFLNLLWKKLTFKELKIGPDYTLHLIHKSGQESLGTTSAGERGLLALAFTLALHKVSGFDSPILIDSPVHRISDVNRQNIARTLEQISRSKQVILLFTPSEYSEEISNVLDRKASGKMNLVTSQEEDVTCVERV